MTLYLPPRGHMNVALGASPPQSFFSAAARALPASQPKGSLHTRSTRWPELEPSTPVQVPGSGAPAATVTSVPTLQAPTPSPTQPHSSFSPEPPWSHGRNMGCHCLMSPVGLKVRSSRG